MATARNNSKGENRMKSRRSGIALGTALVLCFLPSQADAHWCDDLWASSYNLLVRPESDTVTVPSGGSGSLIVYVQNNMEYALPNFQLSATASGATITATRSGDKVSGTLLPVERAKYTLTITKSGGGTLNATDIDFAVSFGSSRQSALYPTSGGKAAMVRKTDGSLNPTPPPPGLGQLSSRSQGAQLVHASVADYGTTNDGLDQLLQLYCAGRGSWNSGSFTNIRSNCPDVSTTVCPTTTPGSGYGDKFMYPRLWATGELAIRKSVLGARADVLRKRLQCGINDANHGFAGFALMVLGYLGEDAGARSFIEDKISGGGDLGTIAKAALVLMGNADDLAKYKADLAAGAGSSSTFVKAACAAALGIAAKDDATVNSSLIPLCRWVEPSTSDNGQGIYAAQLLNLVAWHRRGWAVKGGDTGAVSFYGETESGGGGGARGTGGGPGSGGASGSGGRPAVGGTGGRGGGRDAGPGRDAGTGSGGSSSSSGGQPGSGGSTTGAGGSTTGAGGGVGPGGTSAGSGGNVASGGSAGDPASGGTRSSGGVSGSGGEPGGGATGITQRSDAGCDCNLGGRGSTGAFSVLVLAGLALLLGRRRR